MTKRFPFKDIVNFRDLADFTTKNGDVSQTGNVYRSSFLFKHPDDLSLFKTLDIQSIIDLRSPSEISRNPNPYHKDVPFYVTANISGTTDRGRSAKLSMTSNDPYFMKHRYLEYVTDGMPEIKKVFEHLLVQKHLPAVIHCSAGKDRTGVLVYLLLSLHNIPLADIIADYQVSYTYIKSDSRIINDKETLNIYHSYPETLEGFHTLFIEKFHSVKQYFVLLGFNDEDIACLSQILL